MPAVVNGVIAVLDLLTVELDVEVVLALEVVALLLLLLLLHNLLHPIVDVPEANA